MKERFSRNIPAITSEQQSILGERHVCIIGCGGLGGYIVEYLTRIGVGHLTVVDGDTFEETNRNRQLLSNADNLGTFKAEEAVRHAKTIMSDIDISAKPVFLDERNAPQILQGADVVMDALDSAESRRILAKACREMKLPLIHGAIQGWNAQIMVCMPESSAMEMLYSQAAESADKSCLSFTPALCAAIQCAEAVKLLLGEENSLENRLLLADLRSMEFETIRLAE